MKYACVLEVDLFAWGMKGPAGFWQACVKEWRAHFLLEGRRICIYWREAADLCVMWNTHTHIHFSACANAGALGNGAGGGQDAQPQPTTERGAPLNTGEGTALARMHSRAFTCALEVHLFAWGRAGFWQVCVCVQERGVITLLEGHAICLSEAADLCLIWNTHTFSCMRKCRVLRQWSGRRPRCVATAHNWAWCTSEHRWGKRSCWNALMCVRLCIGTSQLLCMRKGLVGFWQACVKEWRARCLLAWGCRSVCLVSDLYAPGCMHRCWVLGQWSGRRSGWGTTWKEAAGPSKGEWQQISTWASGRRAPSQAYELAPGDFRVLHQGHSGVPEEDNSVRRGRDDKEFQGGRLPEDEDEEDDDDDVGQKAAKQQLRDTCQKALLDGDSGTLSGLYGEVMKLTKYKKLKNDVHAALRCSD